MKDFTSWLALLMAVSFSVWGCSRKEEQQGAVTLSVLMAPDPTGIFHELVRDFEKENPSIRLNVLIGPTSTNGRQDLYVASFLSGESAYDLVYADIVWIAKFASAGWLEDLTERWSKEQWERFISAALDGSSYQGRMYSVPIQMDVGVLFYRRDLLEQAGLKPPETLAELVRIGQQLQTPGRRWGFLWQGKQYEGLSCNFLEMLTAHGGFWIDAKTKQVGLAEPASVAALTFMRDCLVRWTVTPPGVTTYTEEESRQSFHAGRAVFLRNWPYVLSLSRKQGTLSDKVGVTSLPKTAEGRSAGALGGWGFGIAQSSVHKEEAWKFCEFISSLRQARRLNEAVGMQPALRSFYEESTDSLQRAVYDALQHAVSRPSLPQYEQASDILQRHVSAALSGRQTPEAALKQAAYETELLLARGETHHE